MGLFRGNGGDDRFVSGAAAEIFYGGTGNDTAVYTRRAAIIVAEDGVTEGLGGAGRDTLAGGGGNDRFVFISPTEAPDVITDFSSAASGNNDQFAIRGAAFGSLALGALAGRQFISRGDNLAQDLDDRFIFRTIDTTLWFDSNGKQAGGLTLLADLQAGALMSYQDIIII